MRVFKICIWTFFIFSWTISWRILSKYKVTWCGVNHLSVIQFLLEVVALDFHAALFMHLKWWCSQPPWLQRAGLCSRLWTWDFCLCGTSEETCKAWAVNIRLLIQSWQPQYRGFGSALSESMESSQNPWRGTLRVRHFFLFPNTLRHFKKCTLKYSKIATAASCCDKYYSSHILIYQVQCVWTLFYLRRFEWSRILERCNVWCDFIY